ncbi:AhpD-like protein [Gymnopilus junonius]|uniref:AhpD-like protein n=1 Tax=Gymnopilus junonius TaxID=109634 RepID=A0A9P5NFK0_GYMJU|nr:AhpD-like protein [Gymnopilus junonius]
MSAPFRVSSSFLNTLKALFPENASRTTGLSASTESSILRNPWYIVAAVTFSASNRPEGVPRVFEHVLEDLRRNGSNHGAAVAEEKLLAQKLREALFKSGLISGYPKAINALKALHDVMPEELKETNIQRDTHISLAEYSNIGNNLFQSVYGEKAGSVQGLLNSIYPDMGWFSKTIGYGVVYGHVETLSALETSYMLVAALIAGDTPQQIAWHLDGARRSGASLEEIQAVRQLSMEAAKFSGVQWQHSVPEIDLPQN